MTPRDFQKLRSEELWAEFSFPDIFSGPKSSSLSGQGPKHFYNVQTDAAVLGDRLSEGTQKPLLAPAAWEPARPLQGSLASDPKCRKILENVSRGLRSGDTKKSPKTVWEVSRKCLESVFGLFPDFLGSFSGSQAGGPGRHSRDFFGISGPEGPRDPCKGRAGSQPAAPPLQCRH